MDGATAVASDERFSTVDVIKGLVNLVTKSLITTNNIDDVAYLCLHETTRIYALEKLSDSRENESIRRRHAEYCDQWPASAGVRRWSASNAAGETSSWRNSIAQFANAARFEQSSLMASV